MRKKYLAIVNFGLIVTLLLTTGFGCKAPNKEVQEKMEPIEIEYWRVWDNQNDFQDIIEAYNTAHPNIKIKYRKFRFDEYEQQLIEAWAEDRGPDIFALPQTWLYEYQNQISPMPSKITMAYQTVKGTINKEVVNELRTTQTPTTREIKSMYADTVYEDVVINNKVYGLPLSLPTLIMIYNRDIFNQAGIIEPPSDWEEFQDAVVKMTRFDSGGRIVQAGTALGTGYNVARSFDILSVLMMQNGAQMTDGYGHATFFNETSRDFNPGYDAIQFYSDFANPIKKVYSWDTYMPYSISAFTTGKVGAIFGYNYHLPDIRGSAPQLKLGIAALPQVNPDRPVNFTNYWVETVARKSKHQNEAWDFILFASQPDMVKKYLNSTQQPTALKSLINYQLQNEDLFVAANQILTATNWYRGKDAQAAETAMAEMIEELPNAVKQKDIADIIEIAIQKINQTVR